jgi:hypothetical protein
VKSTLALLLTLTATPALAQNPPPIRHFDNNAYQNDRQRLLRDYGQTGSIVWDRHGRPQNCVTTHLGPNVTTQTTCQ